MPDGSSDSAPEPVEGELVAPVEGELVAAVGEQVTELRNLPLPAASRAPQIDRPLAIAVPATVAAAAGGFLLGVVTFVLVRLLRSPAAGRTLARRGSRLGARRHSAEIESTRSFLVDVHVLKR